MLENLFVTGVLMISGGYVFRRIWRMGRAHKSKAPACDSCSSGSCAPVTPEQPVQAERGETPLRMS